jgi:hypothetical protein
LHDTPTGGNAGAGEDPSLGIGSKHCKKQELSAQGEPIICKKLLFLHRCGIEQPARFQIHIKISLEKVCCINKKSLEKVYLCRRNSFEKMSC